MGFALDERGEEVEAVTRATAEAEAARRRNARRLVGDAGVGDGWRWLMACVGWAVVGEGDAGRFPREGGGGQPSVAEWA